MTPSRFRAGVWTACAVLWLLLSGPGAASAQQSSPGSDYTLTVGGRVWVSSGWSNWNFASGGIDPLSDLRWRGVDAVVGEVNADLVWKRLVLMASVGGSRIDQGVLIGEDFDTSGRQDRFSVTRSSVDDSHLVYVNADVGFRALRWEQPLVGRRERPGAGFVDLFVGYQYWQEHYAGFGVTGVEISPTGETFSVAEPSSTRVVTHDYFRHSVRLGGRTEIPIVGGLSLRALAAFSPYTYTEHRDFQHLRDDFANPSISRAEGGSGLQLEGGLAYTVWQGLSVEAGYRYWKFKSGSGDLVTRFTTGDPPARDRLNEAITERAGPYVGLKWRF
jgi:opacity protein-like surface antigen